jgi:alpha-L-fucosidase
MTPTLPAAQFARRCHKAVTAGLVLLTLAAFGQSPPPDAQKAARIAAWQNARFGLFIHWGLYSELGRGEWVQWNDQIPVDEYAKLADQFQPAKFDAKAWVAVAKSAGMKYMVMVTRHHDGFALFDDPGSDFTSVKTAAHRDFVAEYTKAARDAGMLVGVYYSPLDWRFPGFFFPDLQLKNAELMRDQYHRQVKELVSNYGKLDIIWFDGGEDDWIGFGGQFGPGAQWAKRPAGQTYHGRFNWQSDQVYAALRQAQPGAVINNRVAMPADFHSREGDAALGDFDAEQPWELCTTLAGNVWGWKTNATIKPLRDCVQLLVKAAGRDGNFNLNVGPRPDGVIDPPQAQRLKEIGDWLARNGQSIYSTRGGPFLPGAYGVSTHHDKRIYLHILKKAGDGKFTLPALPVKIIRASVLGGADVTLSQNEQHIELSVPVASQNDLDTIVVLELAQSANDLKPISANP